MANHALVLATLQTDSSLINAGATLFVFDEAHHLPVIAAEQFSYRARLGASSRLPTGLRTVALRHAKALPASTRPDAVAFGQLVTNCTDRLALLERYWQESHLVSAEQSVHRFSKGRISEDWVPECEQLAKLLRAIGSQVAGIAAALKEPDDAKSPSEREAQSHAGVELGVYLARLDTLDKLFSAWATHDRVPWAQWIEWAEDAAGAAPDAWLCASPMTAAQVLTRHLWSQVSAAVCTSTTLTAPSSNAKNPAKRPQR